ncbi:MAG: bifunctional glutamate N-acetyltransferase/amino-acid acetyltransferase ArgJ [FCB group bacterium]|jgi:glutamate N-acetyltransferase/amino-acid N-acetyltransferase|nr:bifunctional glutamate N-acetyltransferase/amino-acid acetyltransferase ArgJ [FCB group bacterium]
MTASRTGVTAPTGFRAAGFAAAIKPTSSKKDCALVVSEAPASVAGVFTQNKVKSATVLWNQEICRQGTAQAVFVNSGNANACTGEQGLRDAEATAERVAEGLGASRDNVCVCSTGVIGVPLPMDRILNGVDGCLASLSPEGGADAAVAIMTTDTVPKEASIEVELSRGRVTVGAMAKGSGMIAPNTATMLVFITTDASIEPGPLYSLLKQAADRSFNCICIDNDCSTNDTVLCLANGLAEAQPLMPGTPDYAAFGEALVSLCQDLAQRLVRDGEGATKFVTISVSGADTDEDAKMIARAVAQSQLCKTAFYGNDANWGRIACAAGYSGAPLNPDSLQVWLNDIKVMEDGRRADYREEDASERVRQPEFTVRISVGEGPGQAVFWTSDLSFDYIRINAEYRS